MPNMTGRKRITAKDATTNPEKKTFESTVMVLSCTRGGENKISKLDELLEATPSSPPVSLLRRLPLTQI